MINLELYRIFIAIYREGTISRAALLCGITQPAASMQLAALEKALHLKLFVRMPRKMEPTDQAHELYTRIADSFDWIEHTSHTFLQTEHQISSYRLGAPVEFFHDLLVTKINTVDFRCHITFDTTATLLQMLREERLDACIATYKTSQSGLTFQELYSEHFWLVGSNTLHVPNDFGREWLMRQAWVSYDHKLSIIRRYFKSVYGVNPALTPRLIVPNLHGILECIKSDCGLSVLPDYLCAKAVDEGSIQLLYRPEPTVKNQLYLAYKTRQNHSSLLVQAVLEMFENS